jgi:hypothetical protein
MSDKFNPDRFPIIGTRDSVPFPAVIRHQSQAVRNHGQSVHGLAERGGLSWCELAAVLGDRLWARMDQDAARRESLRIITSETIV